MTTRALFSINDDIMAMFRQAVPHSERSKTIEGFMREEIARREKAKEQRIAQLAAMVESDPDFAQVRAVSDDANAVAGESVE
jgi:hypothetical protein